jgi:putative ABC transport system permease protein
VFFLTYLRRELRHRMRQAVVTAVGLAVGVGLVITVTALSSGVRSAQGKVLGALFGVGTDITVTTATAPASGSAGLGQITPEPYVQHSDTLSSPTQGVLSTSMVAAIARLRDVSAAAGGLILTEVKTTIPADNAPPPPSFQPPVQVSVGGVDLGHQGLGPFAVARLVSGRTFAAGQAGQAGQAGAAGQANAVVDSGYAAAHGLKVGSAVTIAGAPFTVSGIVRQAAGSNAPDVYIPMARAQALAKLGGQVNVVYVQAASAADVGAVTREISRLLPSATVTNSASLASAVAGSLKTTAQLARSLGTWLAVLAVLAAVAVASLLTLAAVARRVREFGTLKALGWRSGRITAQVMGETIAMGVAGAAAGVALGLGGALAVSAAAPKLTATVQTADAGQGGFGGGLGSGGGIFSGTVGGPVQTFANPNATHTVAVPFTAPVTVGAIVLAVLLAIAGALVAGSFGGWRISQLRPAEALARVA